MRFHDKAKKWVTSSPALSERDWELVMEEDSNHPFREFPTTKPSNDEFPIPWEEEVIIGSHQDTDHEPDGYD